MDNVFNYCSMLPKKPSYISAAGVTYLSARGHGPPHTAQCVSLTLFFTIKNTRPPFQSDAHPPEMGLGRLALFRPVHYDETGASPRMLVSNSILIYNPVL